MRAHINTEVNSHSWKLLKNTKNTLERLDSQKNYLYLSDKRGNQLKKKLSVAKWRIAYYSAIKLCPLEIHKNPLLYTFLKLNLSKRKGKKRNLRHTYKNTSHRQKQRPKNLLPTMQSIITQIYNLTMGSKTHNKLSKPK